MSFGRPILVTALLLAGASCPGIARAVSPDEVDESQSFDPGPSGYRCRWTPNQSSPRPANYGQPGTTDPFYDDAPTDNGTIGTANRNPSLSRLRGDLQRSGQVSRGGLSNQSRYGRNVAQQSARPASGIVPAGYQNQPEVVTEDAIPVPPPANPGPGDWPGDGPQWPAGQMEMDPFDNPAGGGCCENPCTQCCPGYNRGGCGRFGNIFNNACGGGACGGGGCGGGRCSGPLYFRGEYLAWWLKGDTTPPLVTTTPQGTSNTIAGQIGEPGTSVLYGGSGINNGMRSGFRTVLGWWINPSARIEGEFFWLGNATSSFNQSSTGDPILARPFYNLQTAAQDAHLIAYPGLATGSISAQERSGFLGAGIRATHNLTYFSPAPNQQRRLDFLYGFRYLRLAENLTVSDTILTSTTIPPGTTFTANDAFRATNNFYGADFGLTGEAQVSRWSFIGVGRIALGSTSQRVSISGNSVTAPSGGASSTASGGLLAMPTNIGKDHQNVFTCVPQIELKLAYAVTSNFRLTCGYDWIYWTSVARPGEQVSTQVNTSQANGGTLAGAAGPLFAFQPIGMWIQGVNVGGELHF